MARIEVLNDTLIDQIAAGEVVERPASVVKELVENALDAEATRIDVAIAQGGLRWICVTDNGTGMSEEDARLALQRHATSKLRSVSDLSRIATLGFRGEALPSIASVARVRIRTRTTDDSVGTELRPEVDAARPPVVSPLACNVGTRIEVADLFARIPARLKFMKSAATESAQITRWLERIALARPDVRITFERDGRQVLSLLPAHDLGDRVRSVLPGPVGERLLPFEARTESGHVSGFASPTDVTRGNTNEIYLFVNGRVVRDRLLMFAVRHAYRDALPPGRQPIAVVYLTLDPDRVDVNVHPAKAEVRFREPEAVRQLVSRAISDVLGGPGRFRADARSAGATGGSYPQGSDARVPEVRDRARPLDLVLAPYAEAPRSRAHTAETPAATASAPEHTSPPFVFSDHRLLGQLLATYLVLEAPGRLVLIDQHAAHECVLFERVRTSVREGKIERQSLLLPIWLELAPSAAEALMQHGDALLSAGYELDWAGRGVRGGVRVGIQAVPALLRSRAPSSRGALRASLGTASTPDWAALLEETAAALRADEADESRGGIEAALRHVLATAACHAACRKGDRLSPEEMRGLLRDLDDTVWFPNCPHGRPIAQTLTESELERRFLRA